ncbi:MAG TPA: acyl-CoA dehydrogenase family protein [Dongiaceae bacterium]
MLSDEQQMIRDNVLRLCERFDDGYWLARDREGEFPREFVAAFAAGGWIGTAMPEEYGGAGLGVTEAALAMQAVAESGAGMSGASAVHISIFAPRVIVKHGSEAQRRRFLPPLIDGRDICAFGVTEPDAGLDTTRITTMARRRGAGYVISGRKVWTSLAQVATRILLLARTTPLADCAKPTDGMSLFYAEFDRTRIEAREIEKMGRAAVDSNQVFIDDLEVPEADRIGEEGMGFRYILESLNPERILIGAEAIGIGRVALRRATQYAKDRVVFGRPIGQNQAIQHPLAESWMELEAANLMMLKAARLYDSGRPCGAEANAAKYLGAEAGFTACTRAVMTHGGYGYAKEFHVERYLREVLIARLAPVSRELILCYIAERELGLPKSY